MTRRTVLYLTDDEFEYVKRNMSSASANEHLSPGATICTKLYEAVTQGDEDPLAPAYGIAVAMLLGAGIWSTIAAAIVWWIVR